MRLWYCTWFTKCKYKFDSNSTISFLYRFLLKPSTLAQDGDARYLAFEVLSGTISTAADVFSLGLAALELVSDFDLPVNGDLWSDIRDLRLPSEITSVLTDLELKQLLYRMIHSNYKQRPTAKDVLDSPTIRDEVRWINLIYKIKYFV